MAGQRRTSDVDVDATAFLVGLQAAIGRMKVNGEKGLARVGLRVQNAARELCPVDTGRLRASIVSVPGRDTIGPYVEVGTNVEYAPFVEYGTSRAPAQPFLRPALAEVAGYIGTEVGGG